MISKLRDFDAKHTGELSESEHSARMKIIEEIKKIQERVGKGNTAINEVEKALDKVGVNQHHIIFLGYPDKYNE